MIEYENVDISALYKTDIEYQCTEYISMLPDETLIYKKSNIFLGLLEHIYNTVLYPIFFKDKGFYNDYNLLNDIFYKIYIPLVYRYGYTPTLYAFCSFVHISDSNITDILSGSYRKDGTTVNSETQRTVSKWYNTCKAATFSRAIDDNSIGAIFAAKAAYGMSDQPQPAIEVKQDNDIVDISFLSSDQDKNSIPVLRPVD